jgi:ribonuclease P protein component
LVLNTPYLRFYYKDCRIPGSRARLGLSVSRKVGNAVQRNIVKRILRECFRVSDLRSFSQDILIVASPRLKSMWIDRDNVKAELKNCWKKAESRLKERM